MTARPIGYYVHHQGAGHRARAEVLARHFTRPCALLGTFDATDRGDGRVPLVHLPDDRIAGFDGRDGEAERPAALHYAPVGVAAIRTRMARIAAWVEAHDPALMVVDVSVEVALFARLLSVPTVVVRLAGNRTDPPHLEAFRAAERLLAPFPAALETGAPAGWVAAKTIYAGFLAHPRAPTRAEPRTGARPRIAVVFGRGGEGGEVASLARAAEAVPDHDWDVFGPVHGPHTRMPPNLALRGWTDDIARPLADAALVVGTGGDGLMADVAALGKRFICIPEARPFHEQRAKAVALARLGAAIHHEGWHADWPKLVRAGLALDPARIAALADPEAAARTAAALERIADEADRRRGRG